MLVIDPLTPTTLHARTESGVFESTDGGSTWSALAIDPTDLRRLYAGTDGGGVFAIEQVALRDEGGCTVTPTQGSGAMWLLLLPLWVLAGARRRARRVSRVAPR